ncbi:hypothetical protein ACTNDN_06840 [Niallia sp. HCP3S3_B10]|uniref:hypothetical protein n=1 Tax=Niallia sp. HCP3S3_B10 TaxID=3438944 RepID=UPI003F88F575
MSFKPCYLSLFISGSILLSACSNDPFVKEAKKINETMDTHEETETDSNSDLESFYADQARPIEEVVAELDGESVKILDKKEVEVKAAYEDPEEFARYAADILYKFQSLQISPEDFYNFILNYGSIQTVEELPQKQDAINIFKTIQDSYIQANVKGESYDITVINLDRFKRQGYFYRKVLSTEGINYFITSIFKEDGAWKYVTDEPSDPFFEETQGGEEE